MDFKPHGVLVGVEVVVVVAAAVGQGAGKGSTECSARWGTCHEGMARPCQGKVDLG